MKQPDCPICGEPMVFFHGCDWDNDRWYCMKKFDGRLCKGEIELETTTYPEDFPEDMK